MATELTDNFRTTRRRLLKGAGSAAALALTIGFEWMGPARRAMAATTAAGETRDFEPNAFLRIGTDDSVTVIAKHVELGQGAYTGIATIVAEELDADWTRVRVESAPADAKRYANLAFGTMQGTGGSSSMANSWMQLREAGAKARAMLVTAAAQQWKVPATSLRTERGAVVHDASGRRATYGSLVPVATALPVPQTATLKDPKQFTLVGKASLPRVDVPGKTNGTAQFTIDVVFPGMLVAVLQRPPLFGATVRSFDAAAAKAVPGVVDVVQVPRGVAVVGKSFWAAKQGRDALKVDWDDTHAEKRSTADIMAEYRSMAAKPGLPARADGDADHAIAGAVRKVSASYEFPYLAHAPMEPLDAVVKLTADHCEIWAGDQFQTVDQANAAHVAGLQPQQVDIHTLYAGGSFGRRANAGSDFIVEAVSIAKALGANGTPVKLQWTREDDIHGGLYRPMFFHKLDAGLTSDGRVVGWRQVLVGQSIMADTVLSGMIKNGIDPTSVEGAANLPYAIPNVSVQLHTTKTGVPVLWWRVVGSSHTAYAVESFVDELAHAAGKDPYQFRRDLLAHEPRMRAVLDLAAERAGWSSAPMPAGKGRGIAVAEAFKTYVAQVAEVSIDKDGKVTVDRVVCAVDCGTPINPDVIAAQMEGGIGFGLGAVLYGAITMKDGRVEQNNFDGYRVLRIDAMPKVEVHIVQSGEAPTGVGEPGVAPLGPAVANAIFAATGKRLRVLPFSTENVA
ncbi:MAG TPA: xanthine dehydrogenase family protein molybdopterin-binding subunit [Paraburkholderia sp.]|jgi:isoquinoline 1-oxidoreductase beta subunit|nr:xanthine dehydrogenase family protein molybdopterin-binding subunit [Paraburkholderia sp.]